MEISFVLGFKPITFHLVSCCLGITFLAGICISLIDQNGPIGSQSSGVQAEVIRTSAGVSVTTLFLDHATSIFRQPLSFLSGVLQNLEFLTHVMTLPGPFKVRCFWVFKWYVPGIFSWRVFSVSTRNETDQDPFVLKLFGSGCDEFCPLEEFGRLTQHLRPQNWTAECRAGMAIDDPTIIIITEFSIAVASFLLLVLVIAVVVSCCVRRDRKDSSRKYQSVNQDYR